MSKISVVINTLNEEKNLPKALASVSGWADDIVIVDMYSNDKTWNIGKKSGARMFKFHQTGYVEPARNYAISKAKGEWVLILDADEEVPVDLRKELKKIIKRNGADYYRIARKNIIFDKWIRHSRWWPDYNVRFFKKGCVNWSEIIHSVPITKGKGVDLDAKSNLALIHHHYKNIEEYIDRLNRYTTLHAELKVKDGYSFIWTDLIRKPTSEFLSRYFQAEGYKDGLHGLILSTLQAFSEFVLYLKIWQSEKFNSSVNDVQSVVKEINLAKKEVNYWQADTLIKIGSGSLIQKLKRKFKI